LPPAKYVRRSDLEKERELQYHRDQEMRRVKELEVAPLTSRLIALSNNFRIISVRKNDWKILLAQ